MTVIYKISDYHNPKFLLDSLVNSSQQMTVIYNISDIYKNV